MRSFFTPGRPTDRASPPCTRILRLARLSLVGLSILLYTGLVTSTPNVRSTLDIPAQALPQALIELGRQANISIVFASASVHRVNSMPIQGDYSVAEALQVLLAGTDLQPVFVEDNVVSITSACGDTTTCERIVEPVAIVPDLRTEPLLEQMTITERYLTGSRIRHHNEAGASPMQVIGTPEIELSGAQTVGEILKFVPAVAGNSTNTRVSNGGDGTATVTLRGLPASNTLVLVNGRRYANDGLAGESFDLNTLSPSAIERIEILKDGASPIYGSDAIAGVVNIILKSDFDGLEIGTAYGESNKGDLETFSTQVTWGHTFSGGNMLVTASTFDQQALWSRDRAVSDSADGRSLGGADLRSSATPAARIGLPDGPVILTQDALGNWLPGESPGDYRPATVEDRHDFRDVTTAIMPSQRQSLYGTLHYDLLERLTGFAELSYSHNEAEATLPAADVFTAFELLPLPVAADNIFNPFGETIVDLRRHMIELGPRVQQNSSDTTRAELGVKGFSQRWQWELGLHWSRSKARERFRGAIDGLRLRRGIGPAALCTAELDCVPVNLFAAPGSLDAQQQEYLAVNTQVTGHSETKGASLDIGGSLWNLPAGAVELAAGLEYREESTSLEPDELLRSGRVVGGSNFSPTSGSRDAREVYVELLLPIMSGWTGVHHLELELAGRHSNYQDFGSIGNSKFGIRYQPFDELTLRASWTTGFSAPTLAELNTGTQQSFSFLDDPCALAENVDVLPGCSVRSDPTLLRFLTVRGGNSELEAEQADSYVLGLTWRPEGLPGLVASLDAFRIDQRQVIEASAQLIVDTNARTGELDDRLIRDANGNISRVVATNFNIGAREIKGIDIALNYHFPDSPAGRFSFAVDATHISEFMYQASPASSRRNLAGSFADEASDGLGALPRWKAKMGLHWRRGRWESAWNLRYIGELSEKIPSSNQRRDIDAWFSHDVHLSRLFQVRGGLRLTLGINNLLDEAAPFSAAAFNDNYDARTYDLEGRYWYGRLSQRF